MGHYPGLLSPHLAEGDSLEPLPLAETMRPGQGLIQFTKATPRSPPALSEQLSTFRDD
jgi:hypothetical protein